MASGGKCAVMTAFGGPEVLEIQHRAIPQPAADEVRIRVAVTGVAYADIKMRHGLYKTAPKPPMVPGYDFYGVIDEVGEQVTDFKVGDRVIGLSFVGACAEYLTLGTQYLALAPAGLDPLAGAALPLNYLTAYQMLMRLAKVAPGDTILVHGGGGGVGTALLDVAKDRGLNVFATASKGKHDLIRSYGATAIDYNNESFVQRLQSAGGADAVFDHIAGEHLARSAQAAKQDGRVIVYGFMSAVKGERHFFWRSLWELFKLKFLSAKRPYFYAILTKGFSQMKHIAQDLGQLAQMSVQGQIQPKIGKILKLEDIRLAHQLLQDAQVSGKIAIVVDEDLAKTSSHLQSLAHKR